MTTWPGRAATQGSNSFEIGKAAGVRQQAADRDPGKREAGQMPGHRVVELQPAAVAKLEDGDGGEGLGRRGELEHQIGAQRGAVGELRKTGGLVDQGLWPFRAINSSPLKKLGSGGPRNCSKAAEAGPVAAIAGARAANSRKCGRGNRRMTGLPVRLCQARRRSASLAIEVPGDIPEQYLSNC